MRLDLSPVEVRVLGCLIEKQRTTPDAYPLTLNSLRLACNQSTNRDPVTDYDEETVREAAQKLGRRGIARFASGHGSRASKYRHLVNEALGLSPWESALLAVLMLRGPQTPGELRARAERLQSFASPAEVEDRLEGLVSRELVARLERRPGEREQRYAHLLGAEDEEPAAGGEREEDAGAPVDTAEPAAGAGLAERVGRLEDEVRSLREELSRLTERM